MRGSLAVGKAGDGVDAVAYVAGREALDWLRAVDPLAGHVIDIGDFRAGLEEALVLYRMDGTPRLILSGAGGEDEWLGHAERLRVAVAAAVRQARRLKQVKRLGIVVEKGLLEKAAEEGSGEAWALEQALVAADMANYAHSLHGRGERPHVIAEIRLEPGDEKALEQARAVAEGVRLARDLANAPANIMGPDGLEQEARELARRLGLGIRVLHRSELESLGMGGILAVGGGSDAEPRLIILEYHGGGKKVAVIGKAVAFDAGGLDLKPPQAMLEMKYDKSGGAAAMGIVAAAARLRLPVDLVALIPAVENMPSGRAYKPLDVIKMYNGITVEIGNTDAEGRLIMADALAYAAERYKPDIMMDLATLTGAAVVALGNHAAALMSNNEELASMLERAAWRAGEPAWRLPTWPVYEKQLESKTADTSNVGGRWAGAITAAKFLEKFVDGRPWAHLDIAGVAWVQDKGPWKPYYPGGATGWGVRTVVEFLRSL